MSTANPNVFQPFFSRLDAVLADQSLGAEARDVLARAGFVLGNLLNAQANLYTHLILDPVPDVVEGEAESAPDSDPENPSE